MARLRLGISLFERLLVDFVLGHWTDPEWGHIDALDAPFARFLELLNRQSAASPPAVMHLGTGANSLGPKAHVQTHTWIAT